MTELYWWLHVLVLISWAAYSWFTVGSRATIGIVVLTSLLIPSWYRLDLFGFSVSLRFAAGLIGLAGYLLDWNSRYVFRLTFIDISMLILVTTHLVSDSLAQGLSLITPFKAYGEWFVPYICGRLAIQSMDDWKPLRRTASVVLVLLTLLALTEAILRVNPFEYFYGLRPLEQFPRLVVRWFMRRAYGPTMHPIFLGLIMNLLLPMTIFATVFSNRAESGVTRFGWGLGALTLLGTIVTGSRAAILGVLGQWGTSVLTTFYRLRIPILAIVGLVAIMGLFERENVIRFVQDVSGERRVGGGKRRETTGTTARLHYFQFYGYALKRAGLFGYGSLAVSEFPVKVPLGDVTDQRRKELQFVDNQYVLMTLRFGYLGVAGFCGAILFSVLTWITEARSAVAEHRWFPGLMIGTLGMFSLQLCTVWLPQDCSVLLLFLLGASSGIALDRVSRSQFVPPVRKRIRTKRSVTGDGESRNHPEPSETVFARSNQVFLSCVNVASQ